MINYEALFKISYGLFIVCSGDKNRGNGYISNTVFQVTSEPPRFAVCCNKNNYTSEIIARSSAFSVSILHTDASADLFGRFGYRSGKDYNKMEGLDVRYGATTGVPIVIDGSLAYLECRVTQTVDVGTHLIFIGDLTDTAVLDDLKEPMTYQYFRQTRKGVAPKNAPTYIDKSKLEPKSEVYKKYECTACGYIYDDAVEPIRFADLPPGWQCPSCGTEKEDFMEVKD